MLEHCKTFQPKRKNTNGQWTEESLAVNMGSAAAELDQQGHTELHKKTSSLCESWDGHLERASR